MRIGIITYHWVYNFGANLQALATHRFLSDMGHDVWILNYRPQELENLYHKRVDIAQADTHEHFCDRYLQQSPLCRSEEELVEFCRQANFDVIVTGSDAVLRLSKQLDREDTRFPNPFWLRWTNSSLQPVPLTAALAASAMGTNYFAFPSSVRREVSDAIRKMAHVSVRDRWTQLMLFAVTRGRCRPELCPDPIVVLDDVFQVPEEYAQEPAANHRRYILLSTYNGMLSSEWVREFIKLAHRQDLQVLGLPLPEGPLRIPADRILPLPLSPAVWYAWIHHAAGFIGVRFHPVLCAMINGVPFVSLDSYRRGRLRMSSKVYDLCARAGARSLCLDNHEMRHLKPRQALEMLQAREQNRVKTYIAGAKRDFSRIAGRLPVR